MYLFIDSDTVWKIAKFAMRIFIVLSNKALVAMISIYKFLQIS